MVLDKYGAVQYVNKHIARLLSIENPSFLGRHFSNYIKINDLNLLINDFLNNYLTLGKVLKKNIVLKQGCQREVQVCFNILLDDSLFSLLINEIQEDETDGSNDSEYYKERYDVLFNNIKVGILVYKAVDNGNDFIIEDINNEAQIIESVNWEDTVGKRLTEVFPGVTETGLLDVFKRVWRTGKSEEHPVSFCKDKQPSGWRSNIVRKLNTGEIIALYTDETDYINAKNQYAELNKQFTLFLDNFPGYAYMRGLDGEVFYANRSFKEDINIHSDTGKNIRNHKFSIEDLDQFREQDLCVLKENKSKTFEDIINGCYLLTTKFPVYVENKSDIIGGISVDITQMRKNEIQLTRLNEFKNILLSLIAHDLKTPFNVQLGFLEMIINEYYSFSDQKRLEYLKIIYDSTSGSYQLLENLLEWSNSNINDVRFEPGVIVLKSIIDRVIQQNSLNISVKKLDISITVPDGMCVWADENMLEVVIRNILVNAIKFSEPFGDIKISSGYSNSEVVLKIEDNGIGMSEPLIGKLFDMTFDKIRNGTKGERGTGLGLYLCNEFMKKNNGRIKVESEINIGSKFYLFLPSSQ